MKFAVQWDEWTGSVWLQNSTHDMNRDQAVDFYHSMRADQTTTIRNLVIISE